LISCHPRYLVCGLTSENEAGGLRSKQRLVIWVNGINAVRVFYNMFLLV
jgi:hypothetical protein